MNHSLESHESSLRPQTKLTANRWQANILEQITTKPRYKALLTCFLLILLPLLGLLPVMGQSFTTLTSLTTLTTNTTTTKTTASVIGTSSVTLTEQTTVLANSFTLPGIGAQGTVYCNAAYSGPLNLTTGQRLDGTLTSTQFINFYILNQQQFSAWHSSRLCDPYQVSGQLYSVTEIANLALHWTPVSAGDYYFVYTSTSTNDAVVTLNVNSSARNVSSFIQYATLSNIIVQTTTETLPTIETSELAQSPSNPSSIISVVIIIAILVGVMLWRRKTNQRELH